MMNGQKKDSVTSGDDDFDEPPKDPMDSPGSSVASNLQREYEDLLRFAIPQFGLTLESPRTEKPTQLLLGSSLLNKSPTSLTPKAERSQQGSRSASVTPTPFLPEQTQLIEGWGNTGATLTDTLRSAPPAERSSRGHSFLSDVPHSKQSMDHQQPQRLLTPGGSEYKAELNDIFAQHSEFDKDLMNLVHSSNADANLIDTLSRWCNDLRRSLMEKSHNSKVELRDRAERLIQEEKHRLRLDMQELRDENLKLQELLRQQRQSLQSRDAEIHSLQEKLLKEHDRVRLARLFANWRIEQEISVREDVFTKVAQENYKRALLRKTLGRWKSRLEVTWRGLVEQSCQDKAMQVCQELGEEYETQLSQLRAELQTAKDDANRAHEAREQTEIAMRKALMRGVCALNMEAMSVIGPSGESSNCLETQAEFDFHDTEPADESLPHNKSPHPSSQGNLAQQFHASRSALERVASTADRGPHKKRASAKVLPQPQMKQPPTLIESGFPTGTVSRINPQKHSAVYVERHHPVGNLRSSTGSANYSSTDTRNMRNVSPKPAGRLSSRYTNISSFDRTVKIVD